MTMIVILCGMIFSMFSIPSYAIYPLIGGVVVTILNYVFYFGGWWYKLRMWSKINKSFEIIKSNLKKANMLIIPTSDYTGYLRQPRYRRQERFYYVLL